MKARGEGDDRGCPLKMPATETGETLGKTTVRTQPRSPKNPQQPEDEMVGQCHRSDQHEFDLTLGGSGRQEGLESSGPWGHKESDNNPTNNWRL